MSAWLQSSIFNVFFLLLAQHVFVQLMGAFIIIIAQCLFDCVIIINHKQIQTTTKKEQHDGIMTTNTVIFDKPMCCA